MNFLDTVCSVGGRLILSHCPECGELIVKPFTVDSTRTQVEEVWMSHQVEGIEHRWAVAVKVRVEVEAFRGCFVAKVGDR